MARKNNVDGKLAELQQQAMDAVIEDLDINPDYELAQLQPKCESPIERLLVEALCLSFSRRALCDLGVFIGPSQFFSGLPGTAPSTDEAGETNFIDTQVEIGSYRADIVVCRWEHIGPDWWLKTPLVVVECDGHDFHERTKEQAQHDKLRDRLIQQAGYSILRFTGSEVWRDAWGCAQQVNKFLEEKIRAAYEAS